MIEINSNVVCYTLGGNTQVKQQLEILTLKGRRSNAHYFMTKRKLTRRCIGHKEMFKSSTLHLVTYVMFFSYSGTPTSNQCFVENYKNS